MITMERVDTSPQKLAPMPSMLLRSLLTLQRSDESEAESETLLKKYSIPAPAAKHLSRYQQAFNGFVSEVPLAMLYCIAQRAHLSQMLDESFPWPAPGLVHVSNKIERHHVISTQAPFQLVSKVKVPKRGPNVSPRRLRPEFVVEFWQQNEKVATCSSVYQVMTGQHSGPSRKNAAAVKPFEPEGNWENLSHWQLGSGMGRRYARISGDFNPIHLHPLVSRWFGFKKPIIHGMYMMARAQAELERSQQRAVTYIDVTFKRPVILPARVQLWVSNEDEKTKYEVRSGDHISLKLEGSVRFD
ncbi:MaoC family dehydratase [Idiomarina sp. HP20-50]|uniref:MaoC family dehydratase n=1 Tax=Idiomarina sp. HP20-50 TaxID=3070813 RepID=UPI00294ACD1B|nr:MaoC/PaaZ C-terminal domain-containing protein [Idiomarina sp. HP20-50]MDV6316722.1 MaoC/PaaZ C-terminal domain-containing protein [Idiomarina sp. HP20-50]